MTFLLGKSRYSVTPAGVTLYLQARPRPYSEAVRAGDAGRYTVYKAA